MGGTSQSGIFLEYDLETVKKVGDKVGDWEVVTLSGSQAVLKKGEVLGYVQIHPSFSGLEVASVFGGEMLNDHLLSFVLKDKELLEAESEILLRLQKLKSKIGSVI